MSGPPAKHFSWHEVRCRHCFKLPPPKIMLSENFRLIGVLADRIREAINRPLVASSWWRCAKHPIEARKVEPGAHHYGLAVDLLLFGSEVPRALSVVLNAGELGIAYRYGIGLRQFGPHDTRFMHVDVAGNMHRWNDVRPWVWTYKA